MEEFVLSRYYQETGKTISRMSLQRDQEAFSSWKNKTLLASNFYFQSFLANYVENIDADYLLELASSKETSVSKMYGRKPYIVEEEPYMDFQESFSVPQIYSPLPEDRKTGCLVVEGLYPSMITYLNEFMEVGTFMVGIVARKQTDAYREGIRYYKQVYDTLLKNGVSVDQPIRKTKGNFGAYILTKKVMK